jgi:tetratricopeptide (TPR) repeat protein
MPSPIEAGREDGPGAAVLRRLVFIELPAALVRDIGSFRPDPAVPIPVETGHEAQRFDPAELTWEAMVAGMLRILAWMPGHEHAAYYRAFVKAVRPNILAELSEAGVVKARNKDWEIAEEIFRALSGLFPEAPEPLVDLAVMFEDRAEAYNAAGKEALAEEMDDRAFGVYKNLLAAEPPFPPAWFNAAFFFLRRRNYERALGLFETYVKIGDDAEKVERAREIVDKLRRQGFLDELFKEAYDLIRLEKEEEGIAKARQFIERNPRVWNGWFLVGWAERRLGRWEEGRKAFEKALELGADGPDPRNELALCLIELGRLDEARASLEQALREEPENTKIITNLGVLALKRGRTAEAEGFFRTALELEPEDAAAARWLANIEASRGAE